MCCPFIDISNFSFSTIKDMLLVLASISSVIVTLNIYSRSKKDVKLAEQLTNVLNFLRTEYLDKEIDDIPSNPSKLSKMVMPKAREFIKNQYPGILEFGDSEKLKICKKRLSAFHEKSKNDGTWENRIAYKMSIALQQVGIATFNGAIPIKYIMSDIAGNAINDWLLCMRLVKKIRENKNIKSKKVKSLFYERLHGEWLVCLAAEYLKKRWDGNHVKNILKTFEDYTTEYFKYNCWKNRNNIETAEKHVIPEFVVKDISDLLEAEI